MTDMQTSLPLLIVRPSILNLVMHFSTQPLTDEIKCPTSHTFALRILFHLSKCWCHTSTNFHQAFWSSSWVNTWLDLSWMIWSTPYHHMTSLVHRSWPCSLFTVASVHRCQILPKLHRLAGPSLQSLNLPFTIATGPLSQAFSWSSPLWSQDSMSCLIYNEFLHHTIWA